jgi:hypothetical protein
VKTIHRVVGFRIDTKPQIPKADTPRASPALEIGGAVLRGSGCDTIRVKVWGLGRGVEGLGGGVYGLGPGV